MQDNVHNVQYWAVLGRGFRAIDSPDDIVGSEVLVTGEPPVFPPDYVAEAEAQRAQLFAMANTAITPLQDAVDIDEATPEELVLWKQWKAYRVALNRIDVNLAPDISWPTSPVE